MNLIALTFILASSVLRPVLSDAFLTSHHIPMARVEVMNRLNINTSHVASTVRHILLSDDDDNLKRSTRDIILGIRGGGCSEDISSSPSVMDKTRAFVSKNFFLLGMVVAVAFAKLFPEVRCYMHQGIIFVMYITSETLI